MSESGKLTQDDLKVLRRVFPAGDTEFLSGNAYITEGAITTRIEEVDPAWSFEVVGEWTRDNFCVAHGRMTINGVSRDGVGMFQLTIKKKDGTIVDATDPEKSAATDALKRCARLFGVGRYLLALPDYVRDETTLNKWINSNQQPRPQSPVPPPAPQPTNTTAETKPATVTDIKDTPQPTGESYVKQKGKLFGAVRSLYDSTDHMANSVKKLEELGTLKPDMTLEQAIEAVTQHKQKAS